MAQRSESKDKLRENLSFDAVLLLGMNIKDKCNVGNKILAYKCFKPEVPLYMVSAEINADWMSVINTPDLSNVPDAHTENVILEYLNSSSHSRCVYLLVLSNGLVSNEDIHVLSSLRQRFGHRLIDQMVPVLVVNQEQRRNDTNDKNLEIVVLECSEKLCLFNKGMDRKNLLKQLNKCNRTMQKQKVPEVRRPKEFLPGPELHPPEVKDSRTGNQVPLVPVTERGNLERNTMTIVLLGQTGSGKSATGNTILGRRQFESHASSRAITQKCECAMALVCGIKVSVIDTPDFFDEDLVHPEKHIQRCKKLSQSKPVVYLLVMHMGRFTDGEREIVSNLQKTFGNDVMKKTVILFTGKEKLKGASLDSYIKNADPNLQQLIKTFDMRCHTFNNNDNSPSQVRKLMEEILDLQANRGLNIKELYPGYKPNRNDCKTS